MLLNGLCAHGDTEPEADEHIPALQDVGDPGLRVKYLRVITLSRALPEVGITCDHAQELVTWPLAGLKNRLSMAWYWWSLFGSRVHVLGRVGVSRL